MSCRRRGGAEIGGEQQELFDRQRVFYVASIVHMPVSSLLGSTVNRIGGICIFSELDFNSASKLSVTGL